MLTERQFFDKVHEIRLFCQQYPYVYLYGAGVYAKDMMLFLHEANIPFCGCCITSGKETTCCSFGIEKPIYEFENIPQPLKQCGFILAMKEALQEEVVSFFENQSLCMQYLALDSLFLRYYHRYIQFVSSLPANAQKEIVQQSFLLSAAKTLTSSAAQSVIISRVGGLGDVLCLEPIIRKLVRQGYQVFVDTQWQDLFRYNRSVSGTFPWLTIPPPFEEHALAICFNDAYEMHPLESMLDSYIATISRFIPSLQLYGEERIPIYDRALIHRHSLHNPHKICINNEASHWACRTFDKKKMREFALYLQKKGCEIYEIGIDDNNYLGVGKNCYGLELHDTVELMSKTDLYVGVDNGLMHLAQAIRLPIFILFGAICPNFRIYDWSRARVMWKNVDELPCAACYHRRMIPCREPKCHWDTVRCMDWTVEEVIEAFETEKYDNPPKLQEEMYTPLWWNDSAE